jgi:heme-degrading monooxygenase HmoA
MSEPSKFPLVAMEAGFKIIPGKEAEFFEYQNKMVPLATSQPGFLSVYGGLIANSDWLYFGVRFASPEQMDAWHAHRSHGVVQRRAYEYFWTDMYIRKWQRPEHEDFSGNRLFCETRLECAAALTEQSLAELKAELEKLPDFGVSRFETLTGHYDPQPYQLVGPLEIVPTTVPAAYSLVTHWHAHADLLRWQASASYRAIGVLGALTSDVFVPFVETGKRDFLRDDRLQRDWSLGSTT